MRSRRSARLLGFAVTTPILACTLIVGSLVPVAAKNPDPLTPQVSSTSATESNAADSIDAATPDAVTVVTPTPDGGLTVEEVHAGDPALTAAKLDSQPGVTASTVKTRQILNAPASDGAARDLQWSLNQLSAEDAWQASTGAGVTVAVLDTGVDAGHPDLAGRVLPGYDATRRRPGGTSDPNGHGTHVAGSIAAAGAVSGIAPDSRILPVRVMNANGGGNTSDIVAGIIWAVNHGANVINMSLGSRDSDKAEEAAVRWARNRGVIVVAAVGNDGGTKAIYPAGYGDSKRNASVGSDPVIGVGAVHRGDSRAGFSQRGNPVDLVAPGVRVLSTSPRSRGSYAWESGTSMSAPFVTGTAALLISRLAATDPGMSATERAARTASALRAGGRDLGAPGTDSNYGSGAVNAARALAAIGAPVRIGMAGDARLIGGARGRAIVSFTAPAGTAVRARLTSAAGSGGARAASNPNDGDGIWSGAGGGNVLLSLPNLSMSNSYTLTVFATSGGVTSRTVTGLRPVALKAKYPKTTKSGSKKTLQIRSAAGPSFGIPGAGVSVTFRSAGKRKTVRLSPMSSRPTAVKIPTGRGNLYFAVQVDAGDGNWPVVTGERVIRRKG